MRVNEQGEYTVSQAALEITRGAVLRWFLVQIIAVVLFSLIFLFFQGMDFSQAMLVGGFISILPNAMFARWWFAYFKAKAANRLVGKFYVGEIIKLLLTVALFILVFTFTTLNVLACLLGYAVAQVAFWLGPLFSLKT